MPLGGKIDDITRTLQEAGAGNEHAAWLHFLALAGLGVLLVIIRESVFELQRDAPSHHANTVDGVHQGFDRRSKDVAARGVNHARCPPCSVVPVQFNFDGWLLSSGREELFNNGSNCLVVNADATNQCPRDLVFH